MTIAMAAKMRLVEACTAIALSEQCVKGTCGSNLVCFRRLARRPPMDSKRGMSTFVISFTR